MTTNKLRALKVMAAASVLLAGSGYPVTGLAQSCEAGELACPSGRPCPLIDMPYEEFIAAPPLTRGRADIPPVADRPFNPDEGDRILVRRFVVDGVVPNPDLGVTPETVQAAADAAFRALPLEDGQTRMTVGQMLKVPEAVTAFYRGRGYLVARVFIPVQTVGEDAVVHLQVLEGRIADVAVEGNKGYSANILRRPSRDLVGQTPTRDPVETALLYAQDYPGVRLFGTFRPGAKAGDTRMILQVLEEDSFGFQAGVDNFGTELTGKYRLRLDSAWKNPLGWGDEANVTLLQSVSPADTTYGSAGYRVPMGPRGFAVYADASHNAFAVNQAPFEFFKLEGTIDALEVGTDWRFKRSRFSNARAGLGAVSKRSQLTGVGGLTVTDDKYSVVVLDAGMDRIDIRFRGVDQLQAKVRQSLSGDFSTNVDEKFTIYEARYSRLQSLGETQTGSLRVRVQKTSNLLSPLEQFALAGPDGVRAYPVGQLLRDSGEFCSLEYQIQAPGFARKQGPFNRQWGDLLQFSLFADYAHGVYSGDDKIAAELSGAGAGIRFGVPGSVQGSIEASKPISSAEPTDGGSIRVYGSVTVKF